MHLCSNIPMPLTFHTSIHFIHRHYDYEIVSLQILKENKDITHLKKCLLSIYSYRNSIREKKTGTKLQKNTQKNVFATQIVRPFYNEK